MHARSLRSRKAEQELRKPVPPLLLSTEEEKSNLVRERLSRIRKNVRRISPKKSAPESAAGAAANAGWPASAASATESTAGNDDDNNSDDDNASGDGNGDGGANARRPGLRLSPPQPPLVGSTPTRQLWQMMTGVEEADSVAYRLDGLSDISPAVPAADKRCDEEEVEVAATVERQEQSPRKTRGAVALLSPSGANFPSSGEAEVDDVSGLLTELIDAPSQALSQALSQAMSQQQHSARDAHGSSSSSSPLSRRVASFAGTRDAAPHEEPSGSAGTAVDHTAIVLQVSRPGRRDVRACTHLLQMTVLCSRSARTGRIAAHVHCPSSAVCWCAHLRPTLA